MGRRGIAVLAVLLCALAGACTVAGSGSPAPSTPAGASPSGAVELPPRPREVRLDGVDPCSLLTEEQRAELGLDGEPLSSPASVSLYPGAEVPLCVVRGFEPRAVSAGLSLVTTVGIERFSAGDLDVNVQPITVHGFPAAVVVPTRFTEFCTVIVDVAPGQLLDVQFRDGGRRPPVPQVQLCQDAEIVAGAVMSTLLDR